MKDKEIKDKCTCQECDCGEEFSEPTIEELEQLESEVIEACQEDCSCGCKEGKECHCHEKDSKACHCHEKGDREQEYLLLAKQIQADFDNYRRRTTDEIINAKTKGQISAIEVFLPCLDTFKEAKKMITDENILKGVEMIEEKIVSALSELGVEKINAVGQNYNPHLHNAIAVMKDEEKENDIILDEFQAGYIFNGKVIRYSKVIVNKKED